MASIEHLGTDLRHLACPFAPTARLHVTSPIPFSLVEGPRPDLQITKAMRALALDSPDVADTVVIPVIEAPAADLDDWCQWVAKLLQELACADHSCATWLNGIEGDGWEFRVCGVSLFVMVLSRLYPSDHPRHSPTPGVGYVLFQAEESFRRRGISSSMTGRRRLSNLVRRNFAEEGLPYSAEWTQLVKKPYRFLRPIQDDDAPIAWWNALATGCSCRGEGLLGRV